MAVSVRVKGLFENRKEGAIGMDDNEIIKLFFARSETAIEEITRKYGRYLFYIAKQILESDEDAEEIVNDTYLRAWNSIPPAEPDALKIYLGRIANRLALNRQRDLTRECRGGGHVNAVIDELADILPDPDGDPADTAALRDAMNRFLASLDVRTRDIFVRRYWYAAQIEEIAKEFSVSKNHVAVMMLRTRKKLADFLKKEGFEL